LEKGHVECHLADHHHYFVVAVLVGFFVFDPLLLFEIETRKCDEMKENGEEE
jgi:hypothetical protein